MRNLLFIAALAGFGVMTSSCSNDEEFSSGWDASLEAEVTFDTENVADISMGVIDLDQTVMDYLDENQGEVKTYSILEVTPTFGTIASTNIVALDFLAELDIYVVADGVETLIGMANPAVTGEASRGIDFIDVDLDDLTDDDDQLEIILRPSYVQGRAAVVVPADVKLVFAFSVRGTK